MAFSKKRAYNDSDLSMLEMDDSAYVLYHSFETGTFYTVISMSLFNSLFYLCFIFIEFPCLSFDVIPHKDEASFLSQQGISHSSLLHSSLTLANYEKPLTVHLIAGTQSDLDSSPEKGAAQPPNSLCLLRLSGLDSIKSSLKQLDRERSGVKDHEDDDEDDSSSSDSSNSEDESDQPGDTKPKLRRSIRSACFSVPSAVNRLRVR